MVYTLIALSFISLVIYIFLLFLYLLIYVGAIAVLFLFIVMIIDLDKFTLNQRSFNSSSLMYNLSYTLLAVYFQIVTDEFYSFSFIDYISSDFFYVSFFEFWSLDDLSLLTLAYTLYKEYTLVFLLSGILLLLSMIASILISLPRTSFFYTFFDAFYVRDAFFVSLIKSKFAKKQKTMLQLQRNLNIKFF